MHTQIRRADTGDLDTLAPLFDAYRRFYGQAADLPRARAWLCERMRQHESVVLLAERDDTAAGFVQLYPMFSSVHTARLWILNDLYVVEPARRSGVARTLLDAAAQFARADGAVRITLETGRDNAAARALYRAVGWHEDQSQWYGLDLLDPGDGGAAR
ncbi:GNAT family N-acetyltransferase [Lysobacter sp. D1-1-M9]|uniref:GNAT family N-acetyltransferase n=1 Tax=Novilysobacter longmucuonensis TaxID=3098603 RepID=UPI002FCB4225